MFSYMLYMLCLASPNCLPYLQFEQRQQTVLSEQQYLCLRQRILLSSQSQYRLHNLSLHWCALHKMPVYLLHMLW